MSSPFDKIKLVEKKETKKETPKKVEKVKPSSIVQGYDPKASFKDILASYEKTGNPYSLPKSTANNNTTESFASILDKWDNKTKPKTNEGYKRVSDKYKATRSFADIYAEHEKSTGVAPTPVVSKPKVEEKPKQTTSGEYKRASKAYEGTKSFSSIMDEFENPKAKAKPQEVKTKTKEVKIPEVKKASFFKEREADDEKATDASWSVFGDHQDFVRPVVEEKIEVVEEKVVEEVRVKSTYTPSVSFGSIMNDFENSLPRKQEETAGELAASHTLKHQDVKKETFFKATEDSSRAKDAAWSVYGDNKAIPREKSEKANNYVDPNKGNKSKKKDKVVKDFGPILDKYQMPDFETMMKEKQEAAVIKKKTIHEKRIMKPEVSLDLHSFTAAEAETKIREFLQDVKNHNLSKASIVCGKGNNSVDGIPVLKPLLINILNGLDYISEYYYPSEKDGGEGVIWIILK